MKNQVLFLNPVNFMLKQEKKRENISIFQLYALIFDGYSIKHTLLSNNFLN